ncbi:MAG TPA: hypothetical protein PLJ11_07730 [Methanomassiliicoccales archaeon]|nr:hypothetical protein [Methanomassiliicoccales archaeon]
MFQSNSELPVNVRRALPDAEQSIFREAYNRTGSLDQAWRAVEPSDNVRWFTCYASVQQVDSAGEMFSIDGLANAMPDYLARGGPMFFEHRAYEIGTAYRGESVIHERKGLPAIKLYCAAYLDCRIADRAWAKIKSGEFPDVSIGGDALSQYWKCDDRSCYNYIDRVEWFDTSPTRKGANPGSSIIDVNMKAKSEQEAPVMVEACPCEDKEKMTEGPPTEGTPAPAPDDAGLVAKSDDPQVVEQLLQKVLAMFSEIKNVMNNLVASQKAPEGQAIEDAVDGGEMPKEAAEGGGQEEVPPAQEQAEEKPKEGEPEPMKEEAEPEAAPPKEEDEMPDDEKMKQKAQEMAEAKVAEVKEMKEKAEAAVMTPRPGMAQQPPEMFAKHTLDWSDPATQRRIARTPARDLIRGILKD